MTNKIITQINNERFNADECVVAYCTDCNRYAPCKDYGTVHLLCESCMADRLDATEEPESAALPVTDREWTDAMRTLFNAPPQDEWLPEGGAK